MEKLMLRTAKENDESFVNELTRRVMREYVEETWESEKEQERYYALNEFCRSTTQIIQFEGIDVGRISVTRTKERFVIDGIHILREFQGKGIGGRVMQMVIDEANKAEVSVELKLLKNNPSKKLYERLGFHVDREDRERLYMRWTG